MTIKDTAWRWRYEFQYTFLQVEYLSEFHILLSGLFYSVIVDGKHELLKKVCLTLS